jgi:hypothetical protein
MLASFEKERDRIEAIMSRKAGAPVPAGFAKIEQSGIRRR